MMATPIFAQEVSSDDVSITAIPPRLGEDNTLKLQPGEKTQIEVRARNSSNHPITIKSSALDFIVGEDGVTPVPYEGKVSENNRWSLASWLTVAPGQQTLQPNESGIVSVVIEVPEDALPGGHYAMVVHQPNTGGLDGEAGSGSGVNQRVGTLLYVIVDGPINEAAFIRDFNFTDFLEFGPVPFSFAVENESDVHIRPQMNIDIYNLFGKKVSSIQPGTKNIFPYESRSFSGEWEQIWGTGPYTAKLTMSFGQQGAVVIARTSFWLLPVKLLIAIITLIGVLIIAGISIRRHIIHRKTDQAARIQELESQVNELRDNSPTPPEQPQG
ncbi:MAG: DUF916 domain-containing protein [Candidatus Pacebacteria bacterium]|nr:DUF916 domain-containing protein [Candidatus Paceibacterota bacterium]